MGREAGSTPGAWLCGMGMRTGTWTGMGTGCHPSPPGPHRTAQPAMGHLQPERVLTRIATLFIPTCSLCCVLCSVTPQLRRSRLLLGTELQPRSPPGRTRAPQLRAAEPLLVPLGPSPAAGAEPGGSDPPGSKGCASELGLHGETLLQVPSSPFHAAPLGSAKRTAWVSSPPLQVPTSFSPSDPCEPSITRAANSLMLVYQAFLRCHRGNLSPVLGGGKSLSRLTSSELLGEPVQENPLARPMGSPLCTQLRCRALSQQRPGSVQLHQPFCVHIPSSALSLEAPK